jgi:hypothetical protein
MPKLFRRWLHRFIPSHFHDPVGLARRLLRNGDPAAVFAMQTALLGLAAAPLDMLLQIAEQRRYRNAPDPRLPLLFICGAPRTGTTLVEQVLIDHLPFTFINNLTAVFPRAPLTANRIFRPVPRGGNGYHNYYGKTVGFSGPNDGLHLWDRWLGKDRTKIRGSLTPEEQVDMRRFFGAMEQLFGRPILAKNNSLSACASLVARVFDRAYFICMTRDPLYLAQSQLKARLDIHGRDDIPYGLSQSAGNGSASTDVVEDICRQVLFHEQIVREQQSRIGTERFWVVQYEAFCQNPSALVDEVATRVLGQPSPIGAARLPAFTASTRVRIEPERFSQIAETLRRLGHG